jgi:hypothetical protein
VEEAAMVLGAMAKVFMVRRERGGGWGKGKWGEGERQWCWHGMAQ